MFKKKIYTFGSEIWTRYLFVSIFIIILLHLGSTMIKNIFLIRRWSLDQSSYITKKKKKNSWSHRHQHKHDNKI